MVHLPGLSENDFVKRYRTWIDQHYLLTGRNQESLTSADFFKNYLFFYALPYLLSEKMQELEAELLRQVQSWSFFTALFVRQLDMVVDGYP